MKYFETVYKKQNDMIELFAPIVLQEVAIIKDTVDDLVQLRNILYNVGNQDVIAVAVRITESDVFGEQIAAPFEYVYEDIHCRPSEAFGNKIAINLHQKTRRVQVEILKAVLQDGSVWVSDPENIVCIQPQHEIEESDEYLYSIDDNDIHPLFYYVENDSCWQCTCGEPNKSNSLRCHRCNRMRDVVKEKFNQSTLAFGFSEHQKEMAKTAHEEDKSKQQEQANEVEAKKVNNSKKSQNKNVYLLLAAVLLIAIIVIMVVRPTSKTAQSQEKEITNQKSEELISQTKNSIQPYVNMVGKQAPEGEEPDVSQDFLDNLSNVFVMGRTGTVEHEYAYGMGDTIAMMHWRSNEEVTENDYNNFVLSLNDYCGSTGETGNFDDDVQTESIRWLDPNYDLHIISWYEQNIIHIRWQLKDDQTSEHEKVSENVKEEIEATTTSLKPYLALIGKSTDDGSIDVDEEFLDNIDKVNVMGKTGTIKHSTTDGSEDTITVMEWVSNETTEGDEFEEYIELLNQFFNDTATLSHYDNITSEDVWRWPVTSDNLWPICFLENSKAIIRWYDESAVDIPEKSKNELSDSKNTSATTSQKTNDSDYQSVSGLINSQENNLINSDTVHNGSISYDATLRYGSGSVLVFSSKESMDRFMTAMANENQGTIDEMIASGEVGYVNQDTKCNIVEQHISWGEVKILEGAYSGSTVCVVSEAIQKK